MDFNDSLLQGGTLDPNQLYAMANSLNASPVFTKNGTLVFSSNMNSIDPNSRHAHPSRDDRQNKLNTIGNMIMMQHRSSFGKFTQKNTLTKGANGMYKRNGPNNGSFPMVSTRGNSSD